MNEPDEKYLLKTVKVISYSGDAGYTISRAYVNYYMNQNGVIVDFSNSHGLCFGIVFPNRYGSQERKDSLHVYWFEQDEIVIVG